MATATLPTAPDPDPDPDLDPEGFVAAIAARGRRVDTPCGDGTMAWRVWGEGPPLVVGHGAQGAWSHWIRNIGELSRHRTVIAVDLPGHGDSASPARQDHRAIAAALAQGLPIVTGSSAPVDFAGFSFSGTAFAHFAAWYPQCVRRLILIGCGGLDTPNGHVDLGPVRGLEGDARAARLKANLLGLMLHADETVDPLAMHLLVVNARQARFGAAAADMVLPDKLIRILPELRCQVDAIWGEHDRPHPDPAVQETALRTVDPDLDFRVIAGGGHWVMYERPQAFNAALLDMLAQPLRSAKAAGGA